AIRASPCTARGQVSSPVSSLLSTCSPHAPGSGKRKTPGGETIRGGASRAGVESSHRRGHINRPPLYGGTDFTRNIHSPRRVVNWNLLAISLNCRLGVIPEQPNK